MRSKNNKVLILLSTYNGEKYLKEQLDSLFLQSVSFDLLIRDDGSTDSTVDLIEGYQEKYDNIRLICGSNLGYVESFNYLLESNWVNDYDRIAFCDQDDIWLSDKLVSALKQMSSDYDPNIPTMYCSNLSMVDENLNSLRMMHKPGLRCDKYGSLVQNPATGCTMVFNKAAVTLYRRSIGTPMVSHDYTMLLVCMYMGKVIYDSTSHIYYRQHGANVIGGGSKSLFRGVKDVLSDFVHPPKQPRIEWLESFYSIYCDSMDQDKFIISEMIRYRNGMRYKFKIFFDNKFSGHDFKTTLAFKVRLLIGRLY